MQSWKDFYRVSKYGSSRFKSIDKPFCVGISEVKELVKALNLLSVILVFFLIFVMDVSLVKASIVYIAFYFSISALLSLVDTYYTRAWRLKMARDKSAKSGLNATLYKLNLTKKARL